MRNIAHITLTVGLVALVAAGSGGGVEPARPATQDQTVTLQGLVVPSKRISLGMRVPGILTSRPIAVGQYVEAGQLIAELDSGRERAVVDFVELRATSDLGIRAAQADESFRLYELERQLALTRDQATSDWELRAAKISHRLALVQTEQAYFDRDLLQAQLVRDRVLLSERKLTAPFSGWISRTMKEEGEPVDEFEPIAVLVQLDPLWIELNVGFEYFGSVPSGEQAFVLMDSKKVQARITAVDPLVDPGSSTFRVKVEVDNEDCSLVAGTMAYVELHLASDSTAADRTQTAGIAPPATPTGRQPPLSQVQDGRKPAVRAAYPNRRNRNARRSPPDSDPAKQPVRLEPAYGDFDWVEEQSDGPPPSP